MATLGDIKTRIITELSRDDLGDDLAGQLATHIARAIEYYSDTRFWFNAAFASATTTAGSATVAIPSTIRRIDRVSIPAEMVDLIETTFPLVVDVDNQAASRPQFYAYYNDSLWLSPVPAAAYVLNIYGVAQITQPAGDTGSTVWTNQAQDLIVNHTKMTLCRDQFRDPDGTQLALGATSDAFKRLRRETARRLSTSLRFQDATPGDSRVNAW
jgi:hypothetical protein